MSMPGGKMQNTYSPRSKTWLVLDVPNLCHRAFHTTGSLSYNGDATGVTYGFLTALLSLQEEHATKDVVFCFDYGKGLREKECPEYKAARRQKYTQRSDEEKVAYLNLKKEIRRIRDEILPELGYRNILFQKGYEADDLIARTCEILPSTDTIIVVSSDKDLYQLLSKNVLIWNPIKRTPYTIRSFKAEFQLASTQWPTIKALAGCVSDGVMGVKGIGEKTAVKYLLGRLKVTSKAHLLIADEGLEIMKRNLPLVTLPYKGCKIPKFRKDKVTSEKWKTVLRRLGMTTLIKRI